MFYRLDYMCIEQNASEVALTQMIGFRLILMALPAGRGVMMPPARNQIARGADSPTLRGHIPSREHDPRRCAADPKLASLSDFGALLVGNFPFRTIAPA